MVWRIIYPVYLFYVDCYHVAEDCKEVFKLDENVIRLCEGIYLESSMEGLFAGTGFNLDNITFPKYWNIPIMAGLQYEKPLSSTVSLYGEAGLGIHLKHCKPVFFNGFHRHTLHLNQPSRTAHGRQNNDIWNLRMMLLKITFRQTIIGRIT